MKKNRMLKIASCVFLILLAALLWAPYAIADSSSVFTRYNIHITAKTSSNGSMLYKASYANYIAPKQGHLIIPAGTKITILSQRRLKFRFRVESDNMVVVFDIDEPRMRMRVHQYVQLITSSQPISFEQFSPIDIKGISTGKVFEGMSREGVMTALGYPAYYRTPSLSSKTWIYWAYRSKRIYVDFDDNGLVESIR